MIKILIIDDEQEMLESFSKILSRRADLNLNLVSNGPKAIELLRLGNFDLVITDLQMPEVSGMDVLKESKSVNADTPVIIVSGYGTIQSGVEATKLGAFDFLEKPFTSKKLYDVIDSAIKGKEQVKSDKLEDYSIEIPGIICKSEIMQEVGRLVGKVSKGNLTILITGESGTGKELLARGIHKLSDRRDNPFVPVNCGALPENLFESELFGHEKGAFTGAVKTKPGLLEFANQGTFFFDEIGDMSLSLQVKLLRMLEDKKIRRVGGQKEIDIDVRIIAATNQNLEKLIEEKMFREDLYYRLNMMKIEVPPLRKRKEDIILLANQFLGEVVKQNAGIKKSFAKDAKEALEQYEWPGNARELQNLVQRSYFLSSGQVISLDDIPVPNINKKFEIEKEILSLSYKDAKNVIIEKFEVAYLLHHLKQNEGNISKTAEECGIDRRTIHRLINAYNIVYQK